jgi:hypothetical protein
MDVATMTARRRYDRLAKFYDALDIPGAGGLRLRAVVCSDTTAKEPLVRLIVAKP